MSYSKSSKRERDGVAGRRTASARIFLFVVRARRRRRRRRSSWFFLTCTESDSNCINVATTRKCRL